MLTCYLSLSVLCFMPQPLSYFLSPSFLLQRNKLVMALSVLMESFMLHASCLVTDFNQLTDFMSSFVCFVLLLCFIMLIQRKGICFAPEAQNEPLLMQLTRLTWADYQ